jgi:hypothetical protein
MHPLLQNHPKEKQFPVRPRWKYLERYRQQHQAAYMLALLFLIIFILSLFFLIVTLKAIAGNHFRLPENGRPSAYGILAIVFLGSLGCFLAVVKYITSAPVREQLRYYKAGNIQWLEEEKRQALRLHIVQDFCSGFWCETLEYYPLLAQKGNYTYKVLPLADETAERSALDSSWGIVSTEDYHRVVRQLLTTGYHAKEFAYALTLFNTDNVNSKRLATLTRLPEAVILGYLQPQPDGRPPKLIWGYECWRALTIARSAFMAGYITREEAWKDILQAAAYVYELFDSFEDFNSNYRTGNAFWSNSYETTREKIDEYHEYSQFCNWPIAQLPWPARKGIVLPPAMATGYAPEIIQGLKEMQQGPLN